MLINCPECGKEISDRAAVCPNCGFGIQAERQQKFAQEQQILAAQRQAELDETFTPNELYLAAPWPMKPLFMPFSCRGRSPRIEFWPYLFFYFLGIAICIVSFTKTPVVPWILLCWFIYGGICLISSFCRRCHDVGLRVEPGFFVAFFCLTIPIIGWIAFFVIGDQLLEILRPSQPGSNAYGPNPFVYYNEHRQAQKTQVAREIGQGDVLGMRCPGCGALLDVAGEVEIGQHIKCWNCEAKFSFDGRVVVKCPHCQQETVVDAQGDRFACPTCRGQFTV